MDVPGGLPGEGGACEAESALGKVAALQEARGKEMHGGGGRDTGRPAGGADAGDGGDAGCNGSGSTRAGEGDGEGLFPSSRPLRVFVSQGDVVYVDEVEAVAIRGGDTAETTKEDPADGHTCSGESEGMNGKSSGKSAGESVQEQSESANGGERAPPAFFDPLLNPGSSGGQNQDGGAWSSAVLLLIPLRLGLDELSAGYIPSEFHLKAFCSMVQLVRMFVWTWVTLGESP